MIKDDLLHMWFVSKQRPLHWKTWKWISFLVHETQQRALFWHLLATMEDQRQRGDLQLSDRPTRSPLSAFCLRFNPSVAALKWWNLSGVALKRRKGRNDLINAGSSITDSMEYEPQWALQSHCVIPVQPTDYSSRKCKRDEIETHAAHDETYLTLAVVGGWVGVRVCLNVLSLCQCCCQDAEWGK